MYHNGDLYRCKIGDKIYGPMEASQLLRVPGFTPNSLIARGDDTIWRPASETIGMNTSFDWREDPGAGRVLDLGLQQAWSALSKGGSFPHAVNRPKPVHQPAPRLEHRIPVFRAASSRPTPLAKWVVPEAPLVWHEPEPLTLMSLIRSVRWSFGLAGTLFLLWGILS
jgi:hypothetical protein